MISDRLLSIVRCADCRGVLDRHDGGSLVCRDCGRRYESHGDYLDVRPRRMFEEQTKYLDEALHTDARHERVSPPLLGSRIRNDMLREFLAPARGELVVDLGCGSGRALLWNRDLGADMLGIDIAPFFSRDARQQVDLMLGDLRTLPFADATFDAVTISFGLRNIVDPLAGLAELRRVTKPGG